MQLSNRVSEDKRTCSDGLSKLSGLTIPPYDGSAQATDIFLRLQL